ncbi:MAG: DUF4012 domain-containing protein [Patescibacteria group bacterium]|nr:DUF4012 domain-containing protein [Patescibacteria group bacterium]
MSKKTTKDYSINIGLSSEEISSPHVLNLKEKNVETLYATSISEETIIKRSWWRRFKADLFLLFSSHKDYPTIRASSENYHPRFKELFIVNLIGLILLIIWKIIDAFLSIFTKKEDKTEECAGLLPRRLKLREAILVFVIVAFVIILPLRLFLTYEGLEDVKERIVSAGDAALGHITLAFENPSVQARNEALVKVEEQLSFATGQIGEINFLLRNVISILPEKGEQLKSGESLLSAGTELTYAAAVLNNRFSQFEEAEKISDKFSYIKMGIEDALPYLIGAKNKLDEVNENLLPEGAQEGVAQIKKMVDGVVLGVDEFLKVSDIILNILGTDEPRRFLLIFQNNNEIRPTGGFIGSFAEVAIRDGEIIKTYFPGGGSYDLDGGLLARLIPPEPLQLIASRWHFRDSNWFPDFPSAAKKMMWFYEKSGGGTVDGVITINASFVENLLNFIGPIEMPEYEKVLSADNFIDEIQYAVEIEYDKEENKPKQILADLMPILIEKLMNETKEDMFEMGNVLDDALHSKDIQFYFTKDEIEEKVLEFGWGGEIKQTTGDYLAVINANIAGQKTDAVIDEKIEQRTSIDKNGNIINSVIVTRTHNGIKGDLFTGVRNVNYVRVYVPKGSTLLNVEGFAMPEAYFFDTPEVGCAPDKDVFELEQITMVELASNTKVTEEFGKTVFGNWTMVDPGESTTYSLTYRLPFALSFEKPSFLESLFNKDNVSISSHNLFIQKQSGSNNTSFIHQIRLPENMEEAWNYSEEPTVLQKLDSDKFFGKLIKKI